VVPDLGKGYAAGHSTPCVRLRDAVKRKSVGILLFLVVVSPACAGPIRGFCPPTQGEPSRSVYLVNHGWHAGVVIKREDISPDIWPESQDFPDAQYLEVGWGDRDFYQAPEFNLWLAFEAATWSSASALHVVGFRGPVGTYFPESEIIEIMLSPLGLERLIGRIEGSYAKDPAGVPIRLGPGLYGESMFYLSRERFHLLKTCNVWVATLLRSAGCPITPPYAIMVGNLVFQARRFGNVVQGR